MENGKDPAPTEGLEDRVANVLNVVMVIAIGSAICILGLWVLWRFASDFSAVSLSGRDDWMDLFAGLVFIVTGVQTAWFGRRIGRRK